MFPVSGVAPWVPDHFSVWAVQLKKRRMGPAGDACRSSFWQYQIRFIRSVVEQGRGQNSLKSGPCVPNCPDPTQRSR